MVRITVVAVAAAVLTWDGNIDAREQNGAGANPQAALQRDLQTMASEISGPGRTPRQAMQHLERLVYGYRALGPWVGGWGPADYALNRTLARQSLAWLGRTSVWYMNDPVAARAYLNAYDTIGGFYRDQGRFYGPGAYVAYAGGARLARRLALGYHYDWTMRELDRYAMAYGTLATGDGRYIGAWSQPQDLPDSSAAAPAEPLKPIELPKIDTTGLTPEQRAEWDDVRVRFRSTSMQVHGARVLLDQMSERLRNQRLALHPENAAIALKMQGYLEDAVDLIQFKEFELAIEALRRAEYERGRLKGVTGQ
jgi:hypothetical protein